MKFISQTLFFRSGRSRYAHNGIIGISPSKSENCIYYGEDGLFYTEESEQELFGENALSKEDLIELAEFMINRWKAFIEKNNG